MPLTFQVASHPARQWTSPKASTPDELLSSSSEKDAFQSQGIVQTSFTSSRLEANHITASQNGLVYAAFHAYAGHHHLIIRPDDVWASILSQLSFYVNAHAEELRSLFVAHQGQKELEVVEIGTVKTVDFGKLAERMTHLIHKNVLDPDLRSWIIPDFSTTTPNDRVVASVLMMGTLQKYFSYRMTLICGIPTVTLEGERRDWERLLEKLPKLETLGDEPKQFAALLKPILRHFVASFDDPQSESVRTFWERIAHKTGGSGPYYLSGWITAFCFWDQDGKSLYGNGPEGPVSLKAFEGRRAGCDIDGVLYHRVNTKNIPAGFASVPVTVNDNGRVFETKMVAGLMGIEASSTGDNLAGTDGPVLDMIRPAAGWFMYQLEAEEQKEERKAKIKDLLDEQRLLQETLDQDSASEWEKRMEIHQKSFEVGEELRKLNHDGIVQPTGEE
ncbi:hypothetical protein V5O48_008454 [Marasmius crinis-equi]|uniref:DUF4419 domain-containing protein n=1 Tax=Marasmius crinis-equi TaxID=585013 RepID=A0ABR3FE07_9AGAR